MSSVRTALAIARREIGAYFYAPIAYVVGVLFLAIQGFLFWAIVKLLADPEQPAPFGAVLHNHFGGTFLYWAVVLVVVSVIAMRAIADDKRQGTWEALLTAPVDEGAAVVGKWLAAVVFYAALWVPTLLYLWVLSAYATDGASFDTGPVIAAYVGVLAGGASFLAIGIAASAATDNQIIAAVATFVALMALLLIGQLPDIAGDWLAGHATIAGAIDHIDVRGHLSSLARGDMELAALVFYAGLCAVGLALATTLSTVGRRRGQEVRARFTASALVAVIAVLLGVIAERRDVRWDVTSTNVNSLDPATVDVLDRVEEPVEVLVVRAGLELFDDVYQSVDRLVDRMRREQPLLIRSDLDPTLERQRADSIAAEFDIHVATLAEAGAVVLRAGERKRVIDLRDMAGYGLDDIGAVSLSRFRAEEAFAGAIVEITDTDRPTVCFTSGHGEHPIVATDARAHWAAIADRIRRDGMAVDTIGFVGGGVPARCRALAIAGPTSAFEPDEVVAIFQYLDGGGRILYAASGAVQVTDVGPVLPQSGLELTLAEHGIFVERAIVIDPIGDTGLSATWITNEGYGQHPISGSFGRRQRVTIWERARPVVYRHAEERTGITLVTSSVAAWGETDLSVVDAADAAAGEGDVLGPVPVAVAVESNQTGERIVAFGSARSLSSALVDKGSAADELVAAAVSWLVGRTESLGIGDKTPEVVRLVMSDGQLAATFGLCVVLIPLGFAGIGGTLWWRRRRA